MRFLFVTVLLAACGTDTFAGSDAATDAPVSGDVITSGDALAEASGPFDPSQLASSLVLWLDPADATTTGDLITAWPDHQHKYQTTINQGVSSQICPPGLHLTEAPVLNNKPVVTFCAESLGVKDTGTLRLGTNPFYIAAVLSPAAAGLDNVLFTKTQTGQTQPLPTGLTLLADNASGRLEGWLNGTANATSQSPLGSSYVYVAFVRTNSNNTSQISVRVNGVASAPIAVNATDDISANGSDIGIGGYLFDQGDIRHFFSGSLAELVVVSGSDAPGLVELYFKKKYGL